MNQLAKTLGLGCSTACTRLDLGVNVIVLNVTVIAKTKRMKKLRENMSLTTMKYEKIFVIYICSTARIYEIFQISTSFYVKLKS